MTRLSPKLAVLPPAQRALWAELACLPPGFVLYVRAKIGLYNLFHQLGARVDCHKAFLKYV